jgi:Transposase IS116/IS110/IS902 family
MRPQSGRLVPPHVTAWAGMCPGNRQSGGKRRARTRRGSPWLRAALAEAAWAASKAQHGYRFFDIVVGQSSQGQDGGDCPFRWSYKVRPSRVTTEAM